MSVRPKVIKEQPAVAIISPKRKAFGLTEPSPLQGVEVFRYRPGFSPITNPRHGDTGWTADGVRVLYADKFVSWSWQQQRFQAVHPSKGWYLDSDYRILRMVLTGRLDWRVEIPNQDALRFEAQLAREAEERRRVNELWGR